MKWYETPIEDLYERALLALAHNDEDTYKENISHAYTLIRQREFQTVGIPDGARVMDYYQGLDALLHMEQSKLRAMTDDVFNDFANGAQCRLLCNVKSKLCNGSGAPYAVSCTIQAGNQKRLKVRWNVVRAFMGSTSVIGSDANVRDSI